MSTILKRLNATTKTHATNARHFATYAKAHTIAKSCKVHVRQLCKGFNSLPDDKILDWSKLKQSADNTFEFDVNSRTFSKAVENTVGKGEIAR